ncbi:MAG: HEAT repeat domain-containing protein [Elusimicrobiota bacterium]|jgi:HEAT repeat protein
MSTKSRILLIMIVLAGLYYSYDRGTHSPSDSPHRPPPAIDRPTPITLSSEEFEKVRIATKDTDPQVRWAAIDLLYRLDEPQALEIIEKALSMDTEPSVRRNAIDILKTHADSGKELLPALRDTEKDIRVAALIALGECGDPSVVGAVSGLLTDTEPEVRMQALRSLARIQERRVEEFRPLQNQLRKDYETTVTHIRGQNDAKKSSPFIPDFNVR